jgi:hypothetical protein
MASIVILGVLLVLAHLLSPRGPRERNRLDREGFQE